MLDITYYYQNVRNAPLAGFDEIWMDRHTDVGIRKMKI